MPQTHFKMRRCCADLMFCSGGTFFYKSINNFTKSDDFSSNSLNSCQPSCFALLREATKREKLNVCTDWVLKLAHPCHEPISKWGAAVRIWCFAPEARFSTNRSTILHNLMLFHEIRKMHASYRDCHCSEKPQQVKNSTVAQIVCWNWPTHAQNLFQNEALLCGSVFLLRRHLFLKIDWTFYKIWWFFIKFYKSMPGIVICIVSRGHKTSTTQCLHRLCVEIDHRCPKPISKIGRCYADLIFDQEAPFS